jgi:hypothetical protein
MRIASISVIAAASALGAVNGRRQKSEARRRERLSRREGESRAERLGHSPRLLTGLAVQIIAQMDPAPDSQRIAQARAAYAPSHQRTGGLVNDRA